MPSNYLQGADASDYGVPNATSAQILQASALIDGYLRRPEGLVYGVDGNDNPAFMSALSPAFTLKLNTAITPGQSVNISVTGPVSSLQPGSVLLIDQANASVTELLTVNSVNGETMGFGVNNNGPNILNVAMVQFAHSAGAVLGGQQIIVEERSLPSDRSLCTLSRPPISNLIAAFGRYGYGRRGNGTALAMQEFNLLAMLTAFGGPPLWEPIPVNITNLEPQTGTLWVPAGILIAYYTRVRVHYVSGWTYSALPYEIKAACANIVNAATNSAAFAGNLRNIKAGDTAMGRFTASMIDEDTRRLLMPYKLRGFI